MGKGAEDSSKPKEPNFLAKTKTKLEPYKESVCGGMNKVFGTEGPLLCAKPRKGDAPEVEETPVEAPAAKCFGC